MTDETRRYIAKLKLNGVRIELQERSELKLYELSDIQVLNQDAVDSININIKNLENGNVLISGHFIATNKLERVLKNKNALAVINIEHLNFDMQSYLFLDKLLIQPGYGYKNLGYGGIFLDFTINEQAWYNFDKAVYRMIKQEYDESRDKSDYHRLYQTLLRKFDFDTSRVERRISERLGNSVDGNVSFGSTGTMFKNCLWSLKYDLYNQRDNAFSKNQLRLADKLRKITLAVVNLLRDHSIIDVKKTLEAVETKSSNSRTDKIEIKYSDRFNREAVAISKKLDKLMKDARWKQI